MKNSNITLISLWMLATLTLASGLMISLRTATQVTSTSELWQKKAADLQEMNRLRTIAADYRAILQLYSQYPATAPLLTELARDTIPGVNLTTRLTETYPAVPGWTTRKASIGLANVSGNELGRFLENLGKASPPWAILDCTLSSSPTPGQLAKVEMVLVTAERK